MSKFSRVKKNDELYNELINKDDTKIIESSLRDYERRTSTDKSEDVEYVASRLKRSDEFSSKQEVVEEAVEDFEDVELSTVSEDDDYDAYDAYDVSDIAVEDDLDDELVSDTLKQDILRDRDLLSEFIEEVKHYNINRGLRSVQDTQINILQSLNKPSDKKSNVKKEVVEEVAEDYFDHEAEAVCEPSDFDLTQEIQKIIVNLDSNDDLDELDDADSVSTFKPLEKEKDEQLVSVFEEIETSAIKMPKRLIGESEQFVVFKETEEDEDVVEEHTVEVIEDDDDSQVFELSSTTTDFKSNELLEMTQNLNLKLDQQEQDLEEAVDKVSIVDRVLSVFIIILIAALLAIIIFGIWWKYKERGF